MLAEQQPTTKTFVPCGPAVMKQRQAPLRKRYRHEPDAAWITDGARTRCDAIGLTTPIHGQVVFGDGEPATLNTGIHRAVGGESDLPNPGEILAAALASCLDSTIRFVADQMGIVLSHLDVAVDFKVDVRGTLMVDRDVPVGFQEAQIMVNMSAIEASNEQLDMILKTAERCCVVMQTLRHPPAISVSTR